MPQHLIRAFTSSLQLLSVAKEGLEKKSAATGLKVVTQKVFVLHSLDFTAESFES